MIECCESIDEVIAKIIVAALVAIKINALKMAASQKSLMIMHLFHYQAVDADKQSEDS